MSVSAGKELVLEPFREEHASAFRSLNEAWIRTYFKMEQPDYLSLGNPKGYILDKGGHILVGVLGKEVVAVGALLISPYPQYSYELAKMAVAPDFQGKGFGQQLLSGLLDLARKKGAQRIYLESSTLLVPALSLYRKLGFREVNLPTSPYERSDIRMEFDLREP
ncbi:GNAT family N-acetyltransferase [Robiginitalea sp. IMCC44478]|uniref:GNAT family N-acetyltransferase n=1 Tax=Robiginitalea sp. IMCC44478 TaxID=3459122 RepID=UPI00404258DA